MSQLLKAKLYSPPTRPELVTRERLFVHLDGVLQRKLALLSAPAGFGKTTLLSAWLHVRNLGARAAWLSLDERDSDPRRFWSYVTGALQTVDANAGAGILDALAAPNPPAFPELLTELINDLEALPNTLLILDDYHLIQAAPVHDSLAFFLDYLPKPLHLVIASRTNPPLPLSRLRGRGQLVELRQADLQFTREETERFLNQIMDLHLPPDIIDKLRNRTEGWVTGLQMAALSLRGRDDAADFVADFAGTHRYILDYLVEEVLERESAKVQRFLLRTAILERLCAPLCDAVLAGGPEEEIIHSSSQEMLAYLDRAHLFVVPLDDQRQWYRYHRLFADLLRARAALQEEARLPLLHRRASVWYEQAGLLDDAMSHALSAGDLAQVAAFIERHGMAILRRGELTTLLRWIGALPETAIQASATLCTLHAWGLLLTGAQPLVGPRLDQAERQLDVMPDPDLSGAVAAVRAYLAAQHGEAARVLHYTDQALALLAPDNLSQRAIVFFTLSAAHLLQGHVTEAGEAAARAAELGIAGENFHIVLPALNTLTGIQRLQGRLQALERTARRALALATGPSGRPLPIAGGIFTALAELHYERNDLDAALANILEATELSRRWGSRDTLCDCYLNLSRIRLAQGDVTGAEEALREAQALEGALTATPLFRSQFRTLQLHLWLAQENIPALTGWLQRHDPPPPNPLHGDEVLALARVQLALARPEAALERLHPLIEMAGEQALHTFILESKALQALAYAAQGRRSHANAALTASLALAQPEGFIRRLANLGPALLPLLDHLPDTDSHQDALPAFMARLRQAIAPEAPPPARPPAQPLLDPLSDRELEILAYVARGLSNREIACTCYIAESTVKSHLNAIYRKLDVKNRTEAVAKARARGVLGE